MTIAWPVTIVALYPLAVAVTIAFPVTAQASYGMTALSKAVDDDDDCDEELNDDRLLTDDCDDGSETD